eukprot:7733964-Alexandrium_andersonii.AAC.1
MLYDLVKPADCADCPQNYLHKRADCGRLRLRSRIAENGNPGSQRCVTPGSDCEVPGKINAPPVPAARPSSPRARKL